MDRAPSSDPAIPSGQVEAAWGPCGDSWVWVGEGSTLLWRWVVLAAWGHLTGLLCSKSTLSIHGHEDVLHNLHEVLLLSFSTFLYVCVLKTTATAHY